MATRPFAVIATSSTTKPGKRSGTGFNRQEPTGPRQTAVDDAGNTVRYVVHRLCETTGAPHIANCAKPPAGANTGGSFSAGGPAQIASNQVYYRITTRITGPRNTVAYLQTVVAL
jgi:type IV pilus assembly protein PilX